MKIKELTRAQHITTLALDEIGDWADATDVCLAGGYPQALHVLVSMGIAEERELHRNSDLSITQWKLVKVDHIH